MTAQIHERLILDGEEMSMAYCPPLPVNHARIVEPGSDYDVGDDGEDDPAGDVVLRTTACWRGYQGTWAIRAGRLYLVGVRGRFQLREGDPVFADWVSGVLRVPQGERLLLVRMGFGSVYERELHIEVEHGVVGKTRVIDNRGKKYDEWEIARKNLPGGEAGVPGGDELMR